MMEQLDSGVMGSGILQCWIYGPATGWIDDKIKVAIILLKTNIPAFHHSIIPISGKIRKPQNATIFSVGCRNSETLITGRTNPAGRSDKT
jgi:hypothetical protein